LGLTGFRRLLLGGLLAIALAAAAAVGAGAQAPVTPAPYVKVFVDNQPVYFDQPAVIVAGRVLVPLRGVFERLGAIVAWDPTTETVLAQRGDTRIALRIGAPQATINGQAALMDVPALLVGGRTMVPLRFLSQALGAQVSWDAAAATVTVTSQQAALPPSQTFPAAPPPVAQVPVAPAPSATTTSGTVLHVNATTYPAQLTVQAGNAVYTYQVVSTTSIIRTNAMTGAGGSVALSALRPGDQVQVTADPQGVAQSIRATYAAVSGRIAAVTRSVIVLDNGASYRLSPSVQVVRGGAAVDRSTLQPGEQVTLRLNPQTNDVWAVTIRQPAASSEAGIARVTVTPANRPLVAGDVLTVTATGPAAGTARFAIAGFRSGLPMLEQPGQPGTYVGTYTVQPGDFVQGAVVTVRITTPGGALLTAQAPVAVSINAAAAAEAAPTITSPVSGTTVGIPFIVQGHAAPGTRVRVTANYSGTVLLFTVNGTLGTQTVTADRTGTWQATFSGEPTVRGGVALTITAVAVDAAGNVISPQSSVSATLQ